MSKQSDITSALGEAREHIILGKNKDAMILLAQITINLIGYLTDEALIVSKEYEEDIKVLNSEGIISDNTAHNFETLIISGVQANSGVDIPKEHVEKALEVLTNEVDAIFNKDDTTPQITENLDAKAKFDSTHKNDKVFEYDENEEPYKGDFSKDMTTTGSTPAFMNSYDDENDFRRKEKLREQMLKSERSVNKRPIGRLIAIILPIVLILLICFIVKGMFFSGPKPVKRVERETTTIIETTETETTEVVETEPPLPKEAGYYDVTGDLVKVRDKATTEGSKVKGTVNKGDKVQVKSFYNNDWAVIMYEGEEAYIARRYIRKDESLSPIFEESGATPNS